MRIEPILVICAAAFGAPLHAEQPRGKFVCGFENAAAVKGVRVSGARAEWTADTEERALREGAGVQLPAVRDGALHLALLPGTAYTTVEFTASGGMATDWSGFESLSLHFENGSEFMIPIQLRIADRSGASFAADNLWLVRARNRFEFPLSGLRTSAGRLLDLAHIASMRLEIRSAEKFERDIWLYRFYLATARKPAVAASAVRMLLDFGPFGSPLLPGAKPVDEQQQYTSWRGYGWTGNPAGLTSWFFRRPDSLTSDWVWADLGPRTASLRIDLPDGRYQARFYGGNYSSKALAVRSFQLAVNGRTVARKSADPSTYYTPAGYFHGIDNWYEQNEDTYAVHSAGMYQTYDFPFEVTGGHAIFTWTGTLAAFGLLVAPEGKEFHEAAAGVEAARREELKANLKGPRVLQNPPEADAAERRRGFLLWSRYWDREVAPYDRPAASERNPQALRMSAARGQRTHVTVTITPLHPLGSAALSVSPLRTDQGSVLPPDAIQVRALKYMWQGWPATLGQGCLYPTSKVPSRDSVNVTFWITATPPARAAGGLYRGSVRVTAGTGGSDSVPIEVRVLPFALTGDHPASYGLWRNSDYNMSYSLRYFLPAKMDYFRRLLDAEAADMTAHGMTSFCFTTPAVQGVAGSRVKLDFSLLEEECRAVKKHGLCQGRNAGLLSLLEVARHLMKETRLGDFQEPEELSAPLPPNEQLEEFSDLFNRRYLDAARQIQSFFDRQGIPVLLYVVDEPRERNINQWNRNLRDSIRYADMLHAALPGARIYIDPMRDEEDGTDYLPLTSHVDVIGTHPWDQSSGIIGQVKRTGKPVLWYYNGILRDRYDYGFQVAASPATGFWQWHFGWYVQPFEPFHAESGSGMTLPGPDGPIDTPEYERMAAGIDDYRYVATLRLRIERAARAGGSGPAVAAAEADLKEFLASATPYASKKDYSPVHPRESIAGRTLDEWRSRLARDIQAIPDPR